MFDRRVRAATPRTGLVLASLAAMAPPRRPPLASRCPRYTVDELWRLNAYLDSLAGERTKLGDAELLAMSLGRVYGGDLQQTL